MDFIVYWGQNVYRQEEEQAAGEGEGAGEEPGEDRCHLSAYNMRLRASQSPNHVEQAGSILTKSKLKYWVYTHHVTFQTSSGLLRML